MPKQESEPNTSLNLDQFAQFSRTVHESIDRTETCSNVANESRLLTDVDRVTVLVKRHGKFSINAISGQPSVNRRSNTVNAVEGLAKEVLQTAASSGFPAKKRCRLRFRKGSTTTCNSLPHEVSQCSRSLSKVRNDSKTRTRIDASKGDRRACF